MPNVDVVDLNNRKVGEVALEDSVFATDVNEAAAAATAAPSGTRT